MNLFLQFPKEVSLKIVGDITLEAGDSLRELFGSFSDRPRISWNVIRVRDLDTGLVLQGRITKMNLTDTQKTRVTFGKPVDKKGFPTSIQGAPGFAASDDAITLTPVDGDPYSVDVAGNHPSAAGDDGVTPVAGSLTISGDADLGDGVETITGVEPYVVSAGKAAGFGSATVAPATEQ